MSIQLFKKINGFRNIKSGQYTCHTISVLFSILESLHATTYIVSFPMIIITRPSRNLFVLSGFSVFMHDCMAKSAGLLRDQSIKSS
jgi:hypothetical protein